MSPWTQFWDMHSGGSSKEPYQFIYIEAPKGEAIAVFYSRFGHSPYRVTCECCGEDYSIDEKETLEQLTAYQRGCRYAAPISDRCRGRYFEKGEAIPEGWEVSRGDEREVLSMDEYLKDSNALFIFAAQIKTEERLAEVPDEDDYEEDDDDMDNQSNPGQDLLNNILFGGGA